MPSHLWPPDVPYQRLVLSPENPCQHCAGDLRICDHRHRDIQVFGGRLHLVCRLGQCKKDLCPMRHRTVSPESEMGIAPPRLLVGWEPFAWIGHRRLAKDWRVAQIRDELHDSYQVELSVDSIEHYIARYQAMLAAQAQDPLMLAEAYRDSAGVILAIDGLQPEKGHETLSVVRELTCKRVWFAVPCRLFPAPLQKSPAYWSRPRNGRNASINQFSPGFRTSRMRSSPVSRNSTRMCPIHPPGVRMAEALQEIRASLARINAAPRLDHDQTPFKRLAACIDRGLHCVAEALANVREHAVKMAEVGACLDPANGEAKDRLALFENLARAFHNAMDPVIVHMGKNGQLSARSVRWRRDTGNSL